MINYERGVKGVGFRVLGTGGFSARGRLSFVSDDGTDSPSPIPYTLNPIPFSTIGRN
jgi:hypothetical protein